GEQAGAQEEGLAGRLGQGREQAEGPARIADVGPGGEARNHDLQLAVLEAREDPLLAPLIEQQRPEEDRHEELQLEGNRGHGPAGYHEEATGPRRARIGSGLTADGAATAVEAQRRIGGGEAQVGIGRGTVLAQAGLRDLDRVLLEGAGGAVADLLPALERLTHLHVGLLRLEI